MGGGRSGPGVGLGRAEVDLPGPSRTAPSQDSEQDLEAKGTGGGWGIWISPDTNRTNNIYFTMDNKYVFRLHNFLRLLLNVLYFVAKIDDIPHGPNLGKRNFTSHSGGRCVHEVHKTKKQ